VLRKEPLDFLQINYSVQEREAAHRLMPLAAERGEGVLVNRPFGGGG
jgi:aryl-alcohol dehydrogenase-like predicted oxidoreductase